MDYILSMSALRLWTRTESAVKEGVKLRTCTDQLTSMCSESNCYTLIS